MVSKVTFEHFALKHPDGSYFLRPDRILGMFYVDHNNPPTSNTAECEASLVTEKAHDNHSIESLHEAEFKIRENTSRINKGLEIYWESIHGGSHKKSSVKEGPSSSSSVASPATKSKGKQSLYNGVSKLALITKSKAFRDLSKPNYASGSSSGSKTTEQDANEEGRRGTATHFKKFDDKDTAEEEHKNSDIEAGKPSAGSKGSKANSSFEGRGMIVGGNQSVTQEGSTLALMKRFTSFGDVTTSEVKPNSSFTSSSSSSDHQGSESNNALHRQYELVVEKNKVKYDQEHKMNPLTTPSRRIHVDGDVNDGVGVVEFEI
jgi:hypothetical protein